MSLTAILWIGTFVLAAILANGLAYLRGRGPEQIGAAVFLVATIASRAARAHQNAFASVELPLAVIDLTVLGLLWFLGLFANRWWPLVAAGAQLTSCTGHLGKALDPELARVVYLRIVALSGWPTMLALCLPMIWRSKKSDAWPSWQPSLPPAARRMLVRLRLDCSTSSDR